MLAPPPRSITDIFWSLNLVNRYYPRQPGPFVIRVLEWLALDSFVLVRVVGRLVFGGCFLRLGIALLQECEDAAGRGERFFVKEGNYVEGFLFVTTVLVKVDWMEG